jgi:shikimate kinase
MGALICLRASHATISGRLQNSPGTRPLLSAVSKTEQDEKIRTLLLNRDSTYRKADFDIDTEGLTPLDVTNAIMQLLLQLQIEGPAR